MRIRTKANPSSPTQLSCIATCPIMKFLTLSLTLLLSSIASASVITATRSIASVDIIIEPRSSPIAPAKNITKTRSVILNLWEARRDSDETLSEPVLRDMFYQTTINRFRKVLPDANILVILGKHQFTVIDGPMDRYDEPIVIKGKTFTFTVILFHNGKLGVDDGDKTTDGRISGNCKQPNKEKTVWTWTCTTKAEAIEDLKAKEGQIKS
ncbi:hypothetical protein BD779DRAFT_292881 [Infundibulicybe gibba]|nr:hypothetical protein BD779DRAFT_292881 [Infundibulicybe gibba]